MNSLALITRTLGEPRALREIRSGSRLVAAVARWRHNGASIDLSSADAYQVVFNISGGQVVEVQTREHVSRRKIRAGSIGLNAPETPAVLNISGTADTLQIFLTQEWIETVSEGAANIGLPQIAACEPRLRAAAVQALVALERGQREGQIELDEIVRRIANRFAEPQGAGAETSNGGLSPGARRRVRALIDERIKGTSRYYPQVEEMATAAGLSIHHFIKAFRRTEGQTPHACVVGFRLEQALDLLLRKDARVDQISEDTGFSSPSHLVSTFRKHLGVTPGALRDAALLRH